MKILFDYQHFSEQRYGGITRYFANIMHSIDQRDDISYKLAALYSKNYYIRHLHPPLNNPTGEYLVGSKKKREISWNQRYSKYCLQHDDYDIFHPTYYHPYFLKDVKKPFVLTVHDMIHERFPESFAVNDVVAGYKRETIPAADKIIAVSHATKKDLISLYPQVADRVEVIHHGVTLQDFPQTKTPLSIDIPKNFILYVGTRDSYKNFDRFAAAFAEVVKAHPNLYLVAAGGAPFSRTEVSYLTELDIIHRCIRFNASDEVLAQLYQNAQLFVFPSLCEGFGFPILEAFQHCCPVACSNTSSLPEVAGEAALYFDPYDTAAIAATMLQALGKPVVREELVNRGKLRLLNFSISDCMDKTMGVYKSLAK
ncbi:glycosyltransferase family 4 protein [Mucilaginibacter sp. RS28]|uniref:Glycosyltransferase family 4 protein n=1 Tax=Mucilaginibacter straminoryzae TaxID=2932774 RepID=A0A9X1X0L3_9SPHI|nr:glycosyltransferase family 1 protein [Mucilaginibacter straminoryzae]MCJ8208431.1 glycosyltransferase family 4 protein [Mucilaginibacter straminoryzae]